MQALRNATVLARLVLAWFALSIGVAVASPVVQPKSLQLVCSGSGAMKLLVQGDDGDGSPPSTAHTLDCPLCASLAFPPTVQPAVQPQPLARAVQSIPAARLAALTASPLPARGPPTFS